MQIFLGKIPAMTSGINTLTLIHHQNATCGVSCGRIPLRRMPNTTPGAAALLPCIWHLAGDQEKGVCTIK